MEKDKLIACGGKYLGGRRGRITAIRRGGRSDPLRTGGVTALKEKIKNILLHPKLVDQSLSSRQRGTSVERTSRGKDSLLIHLRRKGKRKQLGAVGGKKSRPCARKGVWRAVKEMLEDQTT